MTKQFFIGVDGGATKCTVELQDESGVMIGRATSGPANIRISVSEAWQSIQNALQKILHQATITPNLADCQMHMGIGIAGCEIQNVVDDFLRHSHSHSFTTLVVTSDAHTACLGAHAGADGALVIAGTGVVGYQVENENITKVSGWGFPHDDNGGGAWIGLQAAKITMQAYDKRQAMSPVAKLVLKHFNDDFMELVAWANAANSTQFAELAPLVIGLATEQDYLSLQILERAAQAISVVVKTLQRQQINPLPLSFVGGVAPFLIPYLSDDIRQRITPCQFPPEVGAILYVKQQIIQKRKLS